MSAQILVVEDEGIVAKGIQADLESLGYSVPVTASSGEEAIRQAEGTHPDLVLMDVVLKGQMDGIEAAKEIVNRLDIPVVYLTAYQDGETLDRAKATEPFGYLLKPFEEKELHTTIEMALYKHRMEQKIKASERWLVSTLQSLGEAVIATDARLCIRLMNPSAEALTGWRCEDAFGRDLSEICHVYDRESPVVFESLASQAIQRNRKIAVAGGFQIVARDGREAPVEGCITPILDDEGNLSGAVLVLRDISERRQLEEMRRQNEKHLRHAEKMDAVSRLAGGVAHDFNNLLTVILGNTSLARNQLPSDHPIAGLLLPAETAAERAAHRVKQLMGVSGHGFLSMTSLNLNDCVAELEGAMRRTVSSNISLVVRPTEDLWTIQGDPAQVREAILNICLNGQEAMPNGGCLTIATENIVVTEEPSYANPHAQPGEYVRLRIQDTGLGIPPEVRARMFEPFFTTKEPGQGCGMGLALAFGIIEQHHGWIECTSTTSRGTCFDIYWPRYSHPLIPPPAPAPFTRTQRNSATTILLVDDEPLLRELGRTILENQGYQVLLAEDGMQAVDIFQRNRHLIDLVILDLTMPRLSGSDACRRMLEIDPGVRVLFSSGYFAEELTEREDRIVGFIKKPYRQEELAKTVRASLEQVRVPRRDVLLMLVKRLEQALAADWLRNEGAWLERVLLVLDRVERAMRQQMLDVDSPDGPLDGFRETPGQARRIDTVRAKYADFVRQAADLKKDLQKLFQALRCITQDPSERLGLPEPLEEPVRLDVATIRERVERFSRELQNHRQDEINLILESVTTDIGGGD
jgi:PAS domain S-box-containing protein